MRIKKGWLMFMHSQLLLERERISVT